MAETKNELTPSQRVEFASFLLLSALEAEEIRDAETADSLGALDHAYDVLSESGW